MKKEVIIVHRAKNITELIEKIDKINELVFIQIDKALLENEKFIKVTDVEYKVYLNGYQFNIYVYEKSDWYGVLHVTNYKNNNIYSLMSYKLSFWFEGKCGYKTVYIKKEGSKTKIDEE